MKLEQVSFLVEALSPRFYVSQEAVIEAIRYQQSFNIIDNESMGKIDTFVLKDSPFNQQEFQRRTARVVRENPDKVLFLPTPEDIILQKLLWYRMSANSDKKWRDILGVIKLQEERLDFSDLRQWAEDLQVSELLNRVLSESGY